METENVKERLNSLLQKKLSENERKTNEAENLTNTPSQETPDEPVNKKIKTKQDRDSVADKNTKMEGNEDAFSHYLFPRFLLHDVLAEKKRALLKNKQVVDFIQSKIKSDN